MLITITQATHRYATPRKTISDALGNGTLTTHERNGKVFIDTDELDAMFAPTSPPPKTTEPVAEPEPREVPAVPTREPAEKRRRLPTPDELDAAVQQALQSPWRRRERPPPWL